MAGVRSMRVSPAAALRNRSASVRSLVLAASFSATFAWSALIAASMRSSVSGRSRPPRPPDGSSAELTNPGHVVRERRSSQDLGGQAPGRDLVDGGGHGSRGVVEGDTSDHLAGESLRGALQLPDVDLRAGQLVQGHVQGVAAIDVVPGRIVAEPGVELLLRLDVLALPLREPGVVAPIRGLLRPIPVLVPAHRRVGVDGRGLRRLLIIVARAGREDAHATRDVARHAPDTGSPPVPAVAGVARRVVILGLDAGPRGQDQEGRRGDRSRTRKHRSRSSWPLS